MHIVNYHLRKKPRLFSRCLCSHCLLSRLGQLSFAVKKHAGGERPERCRWQIKRGKRLAAVGEGRRRISAEDIRRAPQQGCFRQRKRARLSSDSLMFALPIFTARAIYRPAVSRCPVDTYRQKKAPTFQSRLCVRITYFHGQSPGNYRRRTCA